MVTDLTIAGLVEGQVWNSSAPWIDSVRAVGSYWLVRTLSGLPILAGFLLFWAALVTGPKLSEPLTSATSRVTSEDIAAFEDAPSHELIPTRWLGNAHVIAFGAGVGFFALSFLVLAILPGKELADEIKRAAPVTIPTLTASEQRGRVIYGREGCAYCHTEQVRFLAADVRRFGAPTEAWETKYDYPQLWGTRRIGPDLSREFNLHSQDWQLTHLFDPRLVVRDSVMPPYRWLFEGSANQPTQEGLDVLAYLQSLGRARELSGFDRQAMGIERHLRCVGYGDGERAFRRSHSSHRSHRHDRGIQAAAHRYCIPRRIRTTSGKRLAAAEFYSPKIVLRAMDPAEGGDGKASASLLPKPANLTAAQFSDERLSSVLWNGISGSSMPPWRQFAAEDLRALVAYIRSLNVSRAPSAAPETATLDQGKAFFAAFCGKLPRLQWGGQRIHCGCPRSTANKFSS